MDQVKIVYINLYEDITSIIDRLEGIEQADVILFIPYDSYIVGSVTNFKILKREEIHLGKNIIIVSPDIVVREFARTAGLSVFEEIEDVQAALKEKGPRKRVTTKVFDIISPAKLEPEAPKEAEEEQPQEVEIKYEAPEENLPEEEKFDYFAAESERFKEAPAEEEFQPLSYGIRKEGIVKKLISKIGPLSSINKILIGLITIAVISGLVSAYSLLGEATVKIYPTKDVAALDLNMVADKTISKVNFEQLKIPAQLVVVEKNSSEEFFSTGKKFAREKAKGVITVYNAYSSAPQGLVQNTRFVSPEGKIFRTTKSIIIPGAKIENGKLVPSTINVDVIADAIGPAYNIPPSSFTIPGFKGTQKYIGFYGQSADAMRGGANGEVSYVTRDDIEKAKISLSTKLFDAAQNELENQIPKILKLIPGAKDNKIVSVDIDSPENSIAPKFIIKMKVLSYAFLFDQKDLANLIHQLASAKITGQKTLDIDTQKVDFKSTTVDFARGTVALNIKATETAYGIINEDDIKAKLVGKNESEVNDVFTSEENVDRADLMLWPFWLSRVPNSLDKIKIEIIK